MNQLTLSVREQAVPAHHSTARIIRALTRPGRDFAAASRVCAPWRWWRWFFFTRVCPVWGQSLPGFCTISLDELLCITSPSDQKLKEPEMKLKFVAALDLRVEEQLELVERLAR